MRQGSARHEFHHDKGTALVRQYVVHGRDAGMIQLRDRMRLAIERAQLRLAAGPHQRFDGHAAIERRVAREVHLAHAAAAERRLE
jgi:hypothetical protein